MSRTISFASGNIYRLYKSKNRNTLIDHIKNLDLGIDGVEITFSSKKELYSFKLSKNNERWLRGLKYVTIHAPFELVRKANNDAEVIKQLNIISKLYKKVNAKNVIIHPQDLPRPEILKRYGFKVSTENLPKKMHISISKLRKTLKDYPRVGFCLDISHAYLWSKNETGKLIKAFENKITQIHFSGTYKKRSHQSLRVVSKDFIFSIQPLFKLKAPIVIEEDIKHKSKKFLKEEVGYIKNMLKMR